MESPQKRAKGSVPAKFILKREAVLASSNKEIYDEGLALLKAEQGKIIAIRKMAKEQATANLSNNAKDPDLQNNLAEAIKATHITTEDFAKELNECFVIKDNVIIYKDTPIANLLDSHDPQAYLETLPAKGEGYSPVYKRFSLDESGYSSNEYVSVNGNMLRRIAYRGVTPPEIDLYLGKKPLTPYFHGELTKETPGMHFEDDGTFFERKNLKKTDVRFLKSLGSVVENNFPADNRELLALTQIRQGASKVLSATSTKQDIKSNHGQGFGKFGVVTVDLAQVPTNNILHHYNVEAYDTGRVKAMIQKLNEQSIRAKYNDKNPAPDNEIIIEQATSTINHEKIDTHVDRGNLSFIRNRELLFTAIPYEAITDFKASPTRLEYEAKFTETFKNEVLRLLDEPAYKIVTKDKLGDFPTTVSRYLKMKNAVFTAKVGEANGISAAKHFMDQTKKTVETQNRLKKEAEIAAKALPVKGGKALPVKKWL